ncbi:MAG: hypothetical protein VYA30_09475 [Myxococcota bacterium]|nr:hypothetical protein [Myxococcota bacterium]
MHVRLTILMLVSMSFHVHASSPSLFGAGARSIGLAGAGASGAEGYDCIFHNPACLVQNAAPRVSIGYTFAQIWRELNQDSNTADAVTATTIGLALPLPFQGVLKDRVGIGLAFYIPTNTVLTARVPKPGTPYFAVIDNRAQTVTLQGGMAIRLSDKLSLGVGVIAMSALTGAIDVGPNAEGRIGSAARDQLVARYSPILGGQLVLGSGFDVGLVYRAQSQAEFDLPLRANLGEDFPLPIPVLMINGTAQFDPAQYEFELGVKRGPARVSAGVIWSRWSHYPQPIKYAARPPHIAKLPAPNWHDTLDVSASLQYIWQAAWGAPVLRSGYRWVQSPVPDRQHIHAFLDSNRHVFALGTTLSFGQFDFTLGLQTHVAQARETQSLVRDSNEAALYRHSARIWLATTEIGLKL